MEKYLPKVGEHLYLSQRTGSYYIDIVKTPYTVVKVTDNEVYIQECKLIPPVYHCCGNPNLDRPDLEGQRVWFYDTVAESIEEDPNGNIVKLNWSYKNGWQRDEFKTGYPEIAFFGEWKHQPYLD